MSDHPIRWRWMFALCCGTVCLQRKGLFPVEDVVGLEETANQTHLNFDSIDRKLQTAFTLHFTRFHPPAPKESLVTLLKIGELQLQSAFWQQGAHIQEPYLR